MLLSSAGVSEEALRTIGVLTPYDTAAQPEEFQVALRRLSLLIDHLVGSEYLQFFYPSAQTIELPVDTGEGYDLNALLETDLQYVSQVFLINSEGLGTELEMLRPEVYDDEEVPNPTRTGKPWAVSISRSNAPVMRIFPRITTAGYSVRLSGFKYPDDVTQAQGRTTHGFASSCQLGLVYLLAADLGTGAVTTIPLAERDRLRSDGEKYLKQLTASNARDQVRHPRFTKAGDF